MKVIAKVCCVVAMVSVVAGCASNGGNAYVPKIPAGAQTVLLDYFDQPDNKVCVIAVDPSGEFSIGYDYGKGTTKAAAKVAYEECEAGRESLGIIGKPYVYAVNNKVVYKTSIASSQKKAAETMETAAK